MKGAKLTKKSLGLSNLNVMLQIVMRSDQSLSSACFMIITHEDSLHMAYVTEAAATLGRLHSQSHALMAREHGCFM